MIMRYDILVCMYVMGQYEFSNNCKAIMVLLPRGFCESGFGESE